jgi:hypothetical protein
MGLRPLASAVLRMRMSFPGPANSSQHGRADVKLLTQIKPSWVFSRPANDRWSEHGASMSVVTSALREARAPRGRTRFDAITLTSEPVGGAARAPEAWGRVAQT